MNKSKLFKVKNWTSEEAGLLDEMKSRCLNKGQYIDEKAKDRFKMLCHLEDYGLQYYEQQKEIERLKNGIKELDNMFYETFRISQNGYFSISEWELKEFTDKLKELKEGKESDSITN